MLIVRYIEENVIICHGMPIEQIANLIFRIFPVFITKEKPSVFHKNLQSILLHDVAFCSMKTNIETSFIPDMPL